MSSSASTVYYPGPAPQVFTEIYRRHGHRCPMSTLGGRLGYAARRELASGSAGAPLLARYHVATCALDGIRHTTGCHEGNGSLLVVEEGRHALALVRRDDGCGVEVEIRPETLALAGEFRAFDEALDRDRAELSPVGLRERLDERDRLLDELLERLRTVPDAELMLLRPIRLDPAGLPG